MGAFAQSGLLEPPGRSFGFVLRPLRLGHVLLLEQCNSPILAAERGVDADDILLALIVCSFSAARAARLLCCRRRLRFICWCAGFFARRYNPFVEAASFRAWWQAQWESPRLKPPNTRGKDHPLRAPEHWRLLGFLVYHAGWSYAEALEMPLRQARALLLAYAEARRWCELEADYDIGAMWEEAAAAASASA
jgi:hypothetical protein